MVAGVGGGPNRRRVGALLGWDDLLPLSRDFSPSFGARRRVVEVPLGRGGEWWNCFRTLQGLRVEG